MHAPLTHGEIQRKLARRLRSYAKTAWDGNLMNIQFMTDRRTDVPDLVRTETEHSTGLQSEKEWCRTDVEFDLPGDTLAFEIKTNTADVVNWFTQRNDYHSIGLSPGLVLTKSLAYQLVPHQRAVLGDSYIIIDERDHEWYWNHETTPTDIDAEFTVADPIEFKDECPRCECWTKSKRGVVVRCANCSWSSVVEDL